MKKQLKAYSLIMIFVIPALIVRGQNSKLSDTLNLTNGRWTVCTDVKFSADYKCNNGWTNYDFDTNGTFAESQKAGTWYGTYKLRGNTLSIKRNDVKSGVFYTTFSENSYTIIVLDKNRFYSISKDGPEGTVYTYFERIQ